MRHYHDSWFRTVGEERQRFLSSRYQVIIIFAILDAHARRMQTVFPGPPGPLCLCIGIGFAVDARWLHALGKELDKLRCFAGDFSNDVSGLFGASVGACEQCVKRGMGHTLRKAFGLLSTDRTQWRVWGLKDRGNIIFALAMAYEIDHLLSVGIGHT